MFSSDKWFGASASFYSETINQSLRYNYADSPYLSRTADSGNRRTFTFSSWFKRSSFNNTNSIFGATLNGSNFFALRFRDTDDPDGGKLQIANYSGSFDMDLRTSQVFRDSTNWYHIVVAVDTTQSTSSDRVKLYVNGSQVTAFSTETYPSQNFETRVSNGHTETVGAEATTYSYIDGYLAEVNFIDGTALDPTSFGETKNGVWIPKAISGLTYGTNGFRLTFADSSSLGDDTSGNTNDFTSSGLASTDVVPDSPTNNFATLNSIHTVGSPTLSEGSLKLVGSGTDYDRSYATIAVTSGKWYAEFYYVSGDDRGIFGIVREDSLALATSSNYIGSQANDYGLDFRARAKNNGSNTFDVTNFDTGDIGLLCFDIDNGKLWLGRRDVSGSTTIWYDSSGANNGDPSAGSNPTYTFTATGYTWFIGCHDYNGTNIIANFGQDGSFSGAITSQGATDSNGIGDFNYIESGFLALCSSNLPDTTISPNQDTQADDHFIAYSYTADNTDNKARTGLGFQPDWLWFKNRDTAFSHLIYDSSRGANKYIQSNTANAENTSSDLMSSFDSDGFTTQNDSSSGNLLNYSSDKYIVWSWKANGGTTTSDTTGSLTVNRQTNSDAKFSIITGTTSNVQANDMTETFGHGLGGTPDFIILKTRSVSYSWSVWTSAISINDVQGLQLDTNGALFTNSSYRTIQATSSVIQIGRQAVENNGTTFVCYAFKAVEGYSKFGSYVGNGSTDGPFVFTGFRPAWIMFKRTASADSWIIHDNKRDPYNVATNNLFPNGSFAEDSNASNRATDFLSNGFKLRASAQFQNQNGETFVYMAFAEQPFKFSNAR